MTSSGTVKGMLKTLEDVQRFMDRERLASFGTISMDDTPHIVPVFFTYGEGKVYIQTDRKSVKVRNLLRNRDVGVAVYRDDEAVVINGKAQIIEAEEEFCKRTQDHVDKYRLRLDSRGRDSLGIPLFDKSIRCVVEVRTDKIRFW